MKRRPLGSTGIEVGEIGIGTWELSGDVWGPTDDARARAAILAGLDRGANLVDTAADYGSGRVETLLGGMLADGSIRREEVVVATKVRPRNGVWAPRPEVPIAEAFSPGWIRSECEASLRRLGTDYVDVLYLHTWSRSWAAEDAWAEALAGLKAQGKIRAAGISVADLGASDANVAIALGQVDVIQCVYSVFQQEPEVTLFPLARRFGVGVVARSPFSSGALVQAWSRDMTFPDGDWRATWPSAARKGWLEEQVQMAEAVTAAAGAAGSDRVPLCLGFVLGEAAVSAVIPGSANPDHVRANAAVSDEPPLDPALRARLAALWLDRTIHGTYNGSG